MPNYTTNLNLEKPLQSEQYNVDVFNANADKIDAFAGQIPVRALTADKLTTGANINGVNFKGDTNVITGLGLHSSTEVYAQNNLAYKVIDDNVVVKRSLVNNNTGDNFDDSDYWEEIAMGGSGSGYQLFDIVMKDHVLSYEETLGLAPLGTYVYKEAIAGTRYGYPDFYQKCVDEYNDGTSAYMSSNINIVGSLTDNDGVLSGFTTNTNYAYSLMPDYFPTGASSWELVIKAKMGSTPTGNVGFSSISYKSLNLYIPANSNNVTVELSSNNSTFDIGSIASTGLQTNTYYWFKVEFTGTAYNYYVSTDGITYTLQGTITSSTSIYLNESGIILGADYNLNAGGDVIIDLNETYLNVNGSRFWTGTNTCIQSTNKHRFYDIADKATFDNMYAITGEAWYYGIDTTNERVFLPRSTRFKNGTSADVGEYNPAGLPNITGYIKTSGYDTDGAFYFEDPVANAGMTTNPLWTQGTYAFDASRSSSIYGASNTVEYASTKLIPYMVVGNQSTWSGMTDVVNQGMTILSQVNAGLATKVDLDGSNATFPHITETYENGASWYRVYSDGWCEQGGQINTVSGTNTITLLKPYSFDYDINFNRFSTYSGSISNASYWVNIITGRTNNNFTVNADSNMVDIILWSTRGYIN